MNEPKPFWKSRTIWVNIISGIIAILNWGFGNIIPPQYLAATVAILNVILRLITNQPIGNPPAKNPINL